MQKNWKRSILEVDKLSSNIGQVIEKYKSLDPYNVHKMPSGKLEKVSVELPNINQFENKLIVYRGIKSKELMSAFYVILNNKDNLVYKRDILA